MSKYIIVVYSPDGKSTRYPGLYPRDGADRVAKRVKEEIETKGWRMTVRVEKHEP